MPAHGLEMEEEIMIKKDPQIEVTTIELAGTPVLVRRCGDGPPLLLLHAGVADSRMWRPQMENLCGSFHLIAPDLRGYGGSPVPDGPFAYHEDVGLLLDHYGIDRAWIVAASFGARVAVDFCLVSPERVAGLVLVAPTIGGFEPGEAIEAFADEEERLLEAGDVEAATELNMRMWLDGPYRRASDTDARLRSRLARMQHEAFLVPIPDGVEFLGVDFVATERLGKIACPVLVVVGDQDEPAVVSHATLVARGIPGARLEIVPDAGHMFSLEAPDGFSELVRGFVTGSGCCASS